MTLFQIELPLITDPFRFRKHCSLDDHHGLKHPQWQRLSEPVTQFHGMNAVPSRVGPPALGGSLCPEFVVGGNRSASW